MLVPDNLCNVLQPETFILSIVSRRQFNPAPWKARERHLCVNPACALSLGLRQRTACPRSVPLVPLGCASRNLAFQISAPVFASWVITWETGPTSCMPICMLMQPGLWKMVSRTRPAGTDDQVPGLEGENVTFPSRASSHWKAARAWDPTFGGDAEDVIACRHAHALPDNVRHRLRFYFHTVRKGL